MYVSGMETIRSLASYPRNLIDQYETEMVASTRSLAFLRSQANNLD